MTNLQENFFIGNIAVMVIMVIMGFVATTAAEILIIIGILILCVNNVTKEAMNIERHDELKKLLEEKRFEDMEKQK